MTTTQPEPLGLFLAHRAMLKDLDRLADLAARHAGTGARLDKKRAAAIAAYLEDFCTSIHHHHRNEDDILWPVLELRAGAHVDLTELSDDHRVLDPKLQRIRAGAAALRDQGRVSAALADDLTDLRDTLHEHIDDEEKTIVPLIRKYLTVQDWTDVETKIRKGGGKFGFEVPRVLAVMTDAERDDLIAEQGLPVKIMVKVLPPRFRKRERLVFQG